MKKFIVEFNTTGFYSGTGIWETLDEFCEVEADTAQEAIESAIEYMADVEYNAADEDVDYDTIKNEKEQYAWRATEKKFDEYGLIDYQWEFIEG